MKTLNLLGGIQLPLPSTTKVFKLEEGLSRYHKERMRESLWTEAYNYCLVFIHGAFDLPLHIMITAIGKNLPKSKDAEAIALRFLGEMEIQGYIKFITKPQRDKKDKLEREVKPTSKLLRLKIAELGKEANVIKYPYVVNEDVVDTSFEVRKGSNSKVNKSKVMVVKDIASEQFIINEYIYEVLKLIPPEQGSLSEELAFQRTMNTAEMFLGKTLVFQYFLCSRGRIYDATTSGIGPQGADHERSLLLPTFSQKLTKDGFKALVEAAHGYSEIEWDIYVMAYHAMYPYETKEVWLKADKPYSYLACADLIRRYLEDPDALLPAFIPLDGRCSGLQHWSALVRSDSITKHIGMDYIEAEKDIYEKVAEDWQVRLPIEYKDLATRKAAKVPTMTWAYNATRMTSMEHLKSLYGEKTQYNPDTNQWEVITEGLKHEITARLGCDLYDGLNDTLKDLTEAVSWVSEAARIIAKKGNHIISWITPDGFYCTQNKVKPIDLKKRVILSNKEEISVVIKDYSGRISDVPKHVSAIAPNIIHSMDATHLRMVAKRLKEINDPMIFIHDSFATHCNFRDNLYKIIVEEFIKLYDRNYLMDLKDYWEDKYNIELDNPPEFGNFKLETLKDLKLFFK